MRQVEIYGAELRRFYSINIINTFVLMRRPWHDDCARAVSGKIVEDKNHDGVRLMMARDASHRILIL